MFALLTTTFPGVTQPSDRAQQLTDPAPSNLPPLKAITRLAAFKIHCRSLDESARYYETVFGMNLVGKIGGEKVREYLLAYPDAALPATQPKGTVPEPILVLVLDPSFVHSESPVSDLVFRVPDIGATRRAAERAGYKSAGGHGDRSFNLKDPSGNIVELVPAGYVEFPKH